MSVGRDEEKNLVSSFLGKRAYQLRELLFSYLLFNRMED